ncbi:hypothetical protein, partial [Deinococcus aquaticus]|uniref:hypothetical protein n=1 Tax=Deinococcus aquaticus TaxID=328692 RepID=UPI003F45A9EF
LTEAKCLGLWSCPGGSFHNLLNPHNHMPINGLLNYEEEGNLTPLQMTMRKSGANGPAAAAQQDRSISALMSVRSTKQDPVMHGGEVGPDDGATYKTFRANLGYNLLVEYAQSSIAKMDPEKLTLAQVDKQLNTLGRTLTDLSVLPITKDVMDLFQGMGLRTWENYKSIGGNVQKTEQGAPIKLSQADRTAVVVQLRQMWQAWWPEAKR